MKLIGIWLICNLTIWLYVPELKKQVPHTGEFTCLVLKEDRKTVDTGAPPEIYVDCTEAIGWLNTSHPKKFWTRYEEGRCYE